MSIIQNIEVSASDREGLILNGHAFLAFDICPNNRNDCFSGVQHDEFDFAIFCRCD